MAKAIDFYEKFKSLEKGEFFGYPLEDAIIHAYDISEEELAPYMCSDYFNKPWTFVFREIMNARKLY